MTCRDSTGRTAMENEIEYRLMVIVGLHNISGRSGKTEPPDRRLTSSVGQIVAFFLVRINEDMVHALDAIDSTGRRASQYKMDGQYHGMDGAHVVAT